MRRLSVFCAALILMTAGCDAPRNDPQATPPAMIPPMSSPLPEVPSALAEIARIRTDVYATADLGSTDDLLIEAYPRSLEEMRTDFESNAGGTWCWGASYALQLTLKKSGYQSYILSYGFPEEGLLTHAVTLVSIDGILYLQDPYLNYDYSMPFFDVVHELANGRIPAANVQGGLRDVHVSEAARNVSWAVAPGSQCVASDARDRVLVCRSEANLTLFNERYMSQDGQATLDRLEAYGRIRELPFLLLFPYEIFDGSGTYGKEHPIIRKMMQTISAGSE